MAVNVSLPGLSLPSLGSLPPLGLNSSATSTTSQAGAAFMASGPGDWNVNLGGSGQAVQSAAGIPTWLFVVGAIAGVLWLIKK
jgi:hypothetical protein